MVEDHAYTSWQVLHQRTVGERHELIAGFRCVRMFGSLFGDGPNLQKWVIKESSCVEMKSICRLHVGHIFSARPLLGSLSQREQIHGPRSGRGKPKEPKYRPYLPKSHHFVGAKM